ncbi:uncharacterized protein LOC128748037 [Synchiropus splendidus]|uniref:uncharacterized protein LOC128748037 n=1 Tax=Synchiropus splendidus TaxID=270530 RepID=UPI00237E735D|nr:uncharacterized protein LOC128748037 [Synchiropus splendidus]XP_053702404.1 uncharacterized protein LOC128748037 [Synchiropus splendidus]
MGNVVECCQLLLSVLRCVETPALGETEGSPLLCSEGSECDSAEQTDSWEDDVVTVSTGITSLTLDAEHFLFPGDTGEVTLVDPMVCLLVSEEEEAGVRGSKVEECRCPDVTGVQIFTMSSHQLDTSVGGRGHSSPFAEGPDAAQRHLDVEAPPTPDLGKEMSDNIPPEMEVNMGAMDSESEKQISLREVRGGTCPCDVIHQLRSTHWFQRLLLIRF